MKKDYELFVRMLHHIRENYRALFNSVEEHALLFNNDMDAEVQVEQLHEIVKEKLKLYTNG